MKLKQVDRTELELLLEKIFNSELPEKAEEVDVNEVYLYVVYGYEDGTQSRDVITLFDLPKSNK